MSRPTWNPYLVGAGIGLLSWLAFAWAGKGIGMSTQISSAAALCALPAVGTEGLQANAYFAKHMPKLDYSMVFMLATAAGAAISALWSRSWQPRLMHEAWTAARGPSVLPRILTAFLGGAVILYGARLAGGCTSGHGITGTLQLALSSWIFFLVMFPFGIAAAWLIAGRRPGA
jgi:uncharacterized membrane protein YedE/YeeE